MKILPVVRREINVLSKKRSTYTARWIVALLGILLVSSVALSIDLGALPIGASKGRSVFATLASAFLVYCLLAGVRSTSDCISEERRQGTLGLLFLTPLRSSDILLGKLVSSSLNSCYCLAGLIPVMSLVILFGGVTPWEVSRISCVLLNTMFFSLSAGLLISSISKDARKAMFATFGFVLMVAVGPLMVTLWLTNSIPGSKMQDWVELWATSPIAAFIHSGILQSGSYNKFLFLGSLASVNCLAWMLIGVSCLVLPHSYRTTADNKGRWINRFSPRKPARSIRQAKYRQCALDLNPYFWMAVRNPLKRFYALFFTASIFAIAGWVFITARIAFPEALLLLFSFTTGFLKIWIAAEVVVRMFEERTSGSFELILSSPLGLRRLSKGIDRALFRQFAVPLGILLVTSTALFLHNSHWNLVLHNSRWTIELKSSLKDTATFNTVFGPAVVLLFSDLFAMKWIGMWSAMKSKSSSRALIHTVGTVLFLPWLIVGLFGVILGMWNYMGLRADVSFEQVVYIRLLVGLIVDFSYGYSARNHFLNRLRILTGYAFDYKSAEKEWTQPAANHRTTSWSILQRIPWPHTFRWRIRASVILLAVITFCGLQANRFYLKYRISQTLKSMDLGGIQLDKESYEASMRLHGYESFIDHRLLNAMMKLTHPYNVKGVEHNVLHNYIEGREQLVPWPIANSPGITEQDRLKTFKLVLQVNEQALSQASAILQNLSGTLETSMQKPERVSFEKLGLLRTLSFLKLIEFTNHMLNQRPDPAFLSLIDYLNIELSLRRVNLDKQVNPWTASQVMTSQIMLKEWLNKEQPTAEKLAQIQEIYASLNRTPSHKDILDRWKLSGLYSFQNQHEIFEDLPLEDRAKRSVMAYFSQTTGLLELDFQYFLDSIRKLEPAIQFLPDSTDLYISVRNDIMGQIRLSDSSVRPFRNLPRHLLYSIDAELDQQARNCILQTVVAIESYRLAHGKPPDDLTLLLRELPLTPIIDPHSGSPLIYEPLNSGYQIRSAGHHRVNTYWSGGRQQWRKTRNALKFEVSREKDY